MQTEAGAGFGAHIVVGFAQMIANTSRGDGVIDHRTDQIIELGLITHDLTIAAILCVTVIAKPSVDCTIIGNIAALSTTVHRECVKVCTGSQVGCTGDAGKCLILVVYLKTKNVGIRQAKISTQVSNTGKDFLTVEVFAAQFRQIRLCGSVFCCQTLKNCVGRGNRIIKILFGCCGLCNHTGKRFFNSTGIVDDGLKLTFRGRCVFNCRVKVGLCGVGRVNRVRQCGFQGVRTVNHILKLCFRRASVGDCLFKIGLGCTGIGDCRACLLCGSFKIRLGCVCCGCGFDQIVFCRVGRISRIGQICLSRICCGCGLFQCCDSGLSGRYFGIKFRYLFNHGVFGGHNIFLQSNVAFIVIVDLLQGIDDRRTDFFTIYRILNLVNIGVNVCHL